MRELEILTPIAMGASAKEIARDLKITARTVECHIMHLKLKMGARNRAHLVAIALDQGIIPTTVITGPANTVSSYEPRN